MPGASLATPCSIRPYATFAANLDPGEMDRFTKGWVQHLRNTARQETPSRAYQCPLCDAQVQPNIDAFRAHVRADALKHPSLAKDADVEQAFKKCTLHGGGEPQKALSSAAKGPRDDGAHSGMPTRKRPVSGNLDVEEGQDDDNERPDANSGGTGSSRRGTKKLCSPPASVTQLRGSSPPTPSRSRARPRDGVDDFDRGLSNRRPSTRRLWTPDEDRRLNAPHSPKAPPQIRHGHSPAAPSSGQRRSPQQKALGRHHQHHHAHDSQSASDAASTSDAILRQPKTRPISSDQLVAEVKGIYAGLVLLEGRCIEYDSSQQSADLSQEQYHALISLHRSLLHEHHDFFLASQHPSASEALQRLASKYVMPARMWRHGIHSFLELLRHKLPHSLEHMLTFIYIAYSMMALLYETVEAFRDTWVECLGDLGRYRMAIEDDDIRDREIWTGVARFWYTKASNTSPDTGRLYHHLAILARPNALQQLYYYAKSLCVGIPFRSARDSVMTLFDPLLSANSTSSQRLEPVDAAFVRVHGILFSGKAKDQLQSSMEEFLDHLDSRIGREHGKWLESGYHVGISLSCLLLGFGDESNVLMSAIRSKTQEGDEGDDAKVTDSPEPDATFEAAVSFAAKTYEIVIARWGDRNTLPCLHTILVFYLFMTQQPAAMKHLEGRFPWKLLSVLLNYLLRTSETPPRIDTSEFPGPEKKEAPHPLPEDYAMRGLMHATDYFPQGWFENENIDDDEKYFEPASTAGKRRERILWIGRRIASHGKWLTWDAETRRFSAAAQYDVEIDDGRVAPLPSDRTAAPAGTEAVQGDGQT